MALPPYPIENVLYDARLGVLGVVSEVLAVGPEPPQPEPVQGWVEGMPMPPGWESNTPWQLLKVDVDRVVLGDLPGGTDLIVLKVAAPVLGGVGLVRVGEDGTGWPPYYGKMVRGVFLIKEITLARLMTMSPAALPAAQGVEGELRVGLLRSNDHYSRIYSEEEVRAALSWQARARRRWRRFSG